MIFINEPCMVFGFLICCVVMLCYLGSEYEKMYKQPDDSIPPIVDKTKKG